MLLLFLAGGEDRLPMHLTGDEEQATAEEMDHEPMRRDSSNDITMAQPMGAQGIALGNPNMDYQQAFINNINNNPEHLAHGQPFLPPAHAHAAEWYAQYAVASATALSLSAAGINPFLNIMGNGSSHGQSSNNNIVIDGEVYDLPRAKMLFSKIKEELARSQVSMDTA